MNLSIDTLKATGLRPPEAPKFPLSSPITEEVDSPPDYSEESSAENASRAGQPSSGRGGGDTPRTHMEPAQPGRGDEFERALYADLSQARHDVRRPAVGWSKQHGKTGSSSRRASGVTKKSQRPTGLQVVTNFSPNDSKNREGTETTAAFVNLNDLKLLSKSREKERSFDKTSKRAPRRKPTQGYEELAEQPYETSIEQRPVNHTNGMSQPESSQPYELSPSDGPIVIGLTIPYDESHRKENNLDSAASRDLSSANTQTPVTPSIIITPAREDHPRAPDSPELPRTRAVSSIYSQPTPRIGMDQDIPPVPAIPAFHSFVRGEFPQQHMEPPSRNRRPLSTDTVFEEDDTPNSVGRSRSFSNETRKRNILHRLSVNTDSNRHQSQGWWTFLLSPLLSRSGTSATARKTLVESEHPPVPDLSAISLESKDARESSVNWWDEKEVSHFSPDTPEESAINRSTAMVLWQDPAQRSIDEYTQDHANTTTATTTRDVLGMENASVLNDGEVHGSAAEYYQACAHDLFSDEPYFECVNHVCSMTPANRMVEPVPSGSEDAIREKSLEGGEKDEVDDEDEKDEKEEHNEKSLGGSSTSESDSGSDSGSDSDSYSERDAKKKRNPFLHGSERSTPRPRNVNNPFVDSSERSVPDSPRDRNFASDRDPGYSRGMMGSPRTPAMPSPTQTWRQSPPGHARGEMGSRFPRTDTTTSWSSPTRSAGYVPSGYSRHAKGSPTQTWRQSPTYPLNGMRSSRTPTMTTVPSPTRTRQNSPPRSAISPPRTHDRSGLEGSGEMRSKPSITEPSPAVIPRRASTRERDSVMPEAQPPPYTASSANRQVPRYRAILPPTYTAQTQPQPVSPGPVSPGMQESMASRGGIPMSEMQQSQDASRADITINNRFDLPPRSAPAPLTTADLMHLVTQREQNENRRRRLEKEDALGRKAGGLWRGRGCLSDKGCFGRGGREGRQRRRWYLAIVCFCVAIVVTAIVLATTLTRKGATTLVQSQWLNLTGYPPMPTGIMTVAGPEAQVEDTSCIQPTSLWSCALPKEQQQGNQPFAADQPNFRFEIQFQNGTFPNSTTLANSTLSSKRSWSSGNAVGVGHQIRHHVLNIRNVLKRSPLVPSPVAPSDEDQSFLGNTTDNITAPLFAGEATPFFITVMSPIDISNLTNSKTLGKRDDPNGGIPNLRSIIPPASIASDGTAAAAMLYPLPVAQPVKLYNRGLPTEHYGFYTYFDRSIFLKSNATLNNNGVDNVTADQNGGSTKAEAEVRCTWAQTRFLVQIWTQPTNVTRMILDTPSNSTSTSTSSAQSSSKTSSSANNFTRPGSLPYPVTIKLDRHGGYAPSKMIYCYGMDSNEKIVPSEVKLQLENRASGGTVINPAPGIFNLTSQGVPETNVTGPVDGGTGGCGCEWTNWVLQS